MRLLTVLVLLGMTSVTLAPPDAWSLTISDRMVEPECANIGGIAESCYWYYTFDESRCPGGDGAKCDSLVIFFTSGEMICDISNPDDGEIGELMNQYVSDTRLNYVAVAACQYETSDSSPKLPMYQHAPRIDKMIEKITGNPDITAHWTGEHLLISGTSHGMATMLTSMARTTVDNQPYWQGSAKTAVCMYDGSIDVAATAELLKSDPNFDESVQCTEVFNRNICERYGQPDGCEFADAQGVDTARDTIPHVNPANFALSRFKFVACGETLIPCAWDQVVPRIPGRADLIPGEPLARLCANIRRQPSKRCTYAEEAPGHVNCPWTSTGFEQCAGYFHCQVDPRGCQF
jgi:hypothetical protein